MNQLTQYFKEKHINLEEDSHPAQAVINLFEEKQNIIANLSEQITKYKCEDAKNNKLIKSLQDKITQMAPSSGNTSSTFMMASEFKSNFEELMTSTLPLAFESLFDRPFLFSQCTEGIFRMVYGSIQSKLQQIVGKIAQLLSIPQSIDKKEVNSKIKLSLIKIFQQYWENIVPLQNNEQLQFFDRSGSIQKETLLELNTLVVNEDFKELKTQLHKIAVYMIFQQKQWEFVGINQRQIKQYFKKQCTCLDGWIKQGNSSLLVLSGIKRDGHMHATLKNYVIPFEDDQEEKHKYNELVLQHKKLRNEKINTVKSQQQLEDQLPKSVVLLEKQIIVNKQQVQDSQKKGLMLIKNKSAQFNKQNKENIPFLNKKSKKKDKIRVSFQNSLNRDKSPKNKRRRDESLRSRKVEVEEQIQQKFCIKEDNYLKKKNATTVIQKNINHSQDIIFQDMELIPVKRKPLQQLPVSKDLPTRKKTKPASGRKTSVGKIVHQNNIKDNKQKQNSQLCLNAKPRIKEKAYKDIIKEKLLVDEKFIEKVPLGIGLLPSKSRTDRRKDESRPLKIQGNANKLRQKYIN